MKIEPAPGGLVCEWPSEIRQLGPGEAEIIACGAPADKVVVLDNGNQFAACPVHLGAAVRVANRAVRSRK